MTSENRDERTSLSCALVLPPGFRTHDVLAFHRRDPSGVAERVTTDALQKGLAWAGRAACLTIRFHDRQADATLDIDGPAGVGARQALQGLVQRLLGLTQPIADFEHTWREHPQVGVLIARRPGMRVAVTATPFEALSWAVTGQQISLGAALSLRRKLIQVAGLRHSGGLACYPDAQCMLPVSDVDLRQAGFSQAKAQTLIALSRQVREGGLPLDAWMVTLPIEDMREQMLRMRGIGPWTVDYTLLRGFGWLDGSLHGDVAVRRQLQVLLASPEPVTQEQTKRWLAGFAPWRALVAAHLWALASPADEGARAL